jgi:transcriptional regulator with XRE-family HTH domain
MEREIRHITGLSLDELANMTGVSKQTWSLVESGQRRLPTRAVEILALLGAATQAAKAVAVPTELNPTVFARLEKQLSAAQRRHQSLEYKLADLDKRLSQLHLKYRTLEIFRTLALPTDADADGIRLYAELLARKTVRKITTLQAAQAQYRARRAGVAAELDALKTAISKDSELNIG